jgi:hypothetical protein
LRSQINKKYAIIDKPELVTTKYTFNNNNGAGSQIKSILSGL